jgi:hypothetical protein
MAELELLGNWKGKTKRKFALGVVSQRTLNADTPTEVANEVRKALKYVDIEICSSRPIAAMDGKVPTVWSLSTKPLRLRRAPTSSAASMACRRPTFLARMPARARISFRRASKINALASATFQQAIRSRIFSGKKRNHVVMRVQALLRREERNTASMNRMPATPSAMPGTSREAASGRRRSMPALICSARSL